MSDRDCEHIKVFAEKYLAVETDFYEWTCARCDQTGTEDNNIKFIHNYEHLLSIKRDEPLRHSEDL